MPYNKSTCSCCSTTPKCLESCLSCGFSDDDKRFAHDDTGNSDARSRAAAVRQQPVAHEGMAPSSSVNSGTPAMTTTKA
ncbi:hypothetical protein JCM3766R1_002390 [Sporobolomyces carnicolor]